MSGGIKPAALAIQISISRPGHACQRLAIAHVAALRIPLDIVTTTRVSHTQLAKILAVAISASMPTLVVGAPGVGKTDAIEAAAHEAGCALIISHPVVSDPTDAKGFPCADGEGGAKFLPYGDLRAALEAKQPTLWFLDDLGQASPAVQASFMQLLLARRIGGHVLPDCITFAAATNRRQDRAGVAGILEPVKSRFTILNLEPSLPEWCAWALKNGVPPLLVAFLRARPDLLSDFKPTADVSNSPNPRNWARAGKWMGLVSEDLRMATLEGCVGVGAAGEFLSFLGMAEAFIDPAKIIADPEHAPIPPNLSVRHAVCAALAHLATDSNFAAIVTYSRRMSDAGLGEFATLLISDAIKRHPTLAQHPGYVNCISTFLRA